MDKLLRGVRLSICFFYNISHNVHKNKNKTTTKLICAEKFNFLNFSLFVLAATISDKQVIVWVNKFVTKKI